MMTNQGLGERMIRVVVGTGLLAAGDLAGSEHGYLSAGLMIVGLVLIGTGLIAYCPAWHLLGLSTKRRP